MIAQKVAHGARFGTIDGPLWICEGHDGASIRILGLVTVVVWPTVEGEHPSVRPSFVGDAQKVARCGAGIARAA